MMNMSALDTPSMSCTWRCDRQLVVVVLLFFRLKFHQGRPQAATCSLYTVSFSLSLCARTSRAGQNFGIGVASGGKQSITIGGAPCPLASISAPLLAAYTAQSVVTCTVPPGAGASLQVSVAVSGATSVVSDPRAAHL